MTDEIEPKIIVDDDWKEQVRKEKEQLEQSGQTTTDGNQQIPDASFGLLVTTLTTQALAALGFIPNPESGKSEANRELARHFIDSLGVLNEKTSGNLTEEEDQLLNESLHQLRMAFVASGSTSDVDQSSEPKKSTLELP